MIKKPEWLETNSTVVVAPRGKRSAAAGLKGHCPGEYIVWRGGGTDSAAIGTVQLFTYISALFSPSLFPCVYTYYSPCCHYASDHLHSSLTIPFGKSADLSPEEQRSRKPGLWIRIRVF